jgi:hypothetical protein
MEDDTRARKDPVRLFSHVMNGCHSWCLRACMCRVVRFIPLQDSLLIRISVTPSNMGDGLFTAFKRRINNFIIVM